MSMTTQPMDVDLTNDGTSFAKRDDSFEGGGDDSDRLRDNHSSVQMEDGFGIPEESDTSGSMLAKCNSSCEVGGDDADRLADNCNGVQMEDGIDTIEVSDTNGSMVDKLNDSFEDEGDKVDRLVANGSGVQMDDGFGSIEVPATNGTMLAKLKSSFAVGGDDADRLADNCSAVQRDDGFGSAEESETAGGKKKHRRGKKCGKRHYKPYSKLTWEEQLEADDRETLRANRKREKQFAAGQPMAPYNTTQFLMEQHQPSTSLTPLEASVSDDADDDDDVGSPTAPDTSTHTEDVFLVRDFAETYDNCHAERLRELGKDELVAELIELEAKVERLERRLRGSRDEDAEGGGVPRRSVGEGGGDLSEEMCRLRAENATLRQENERLQSEAAQHSPPPHNAT